MYAIAHALVAPTSSKTMPKSVVMREMETAERTRRVVSMKWCFVELAGVVVLVLSWLGFG